MAAVLALFLGGFLMAPCLHTWNHRADHVHGPTSEADAARAIPDRLHRELLAAAFGPASAHQHAHPHPHGETTPRVETDVVGAADDHAPAPPFDSGHGAGAPAHFGQVLTGEPIFVVVAPVADVTDRDAALVGDVAPPTDLLAAAQARGPPGRC